MVNEVAILLSYFSWSPMWMRNCAWYRNRNPRGTSLSPCAELKKIAGMWSGAIPRHTPIFSWRTVRGKWWTVFRNWWGDTDKGRRRVFAFQSNDIDAFHGNRQRIRPIMRILPIYTQRSTSTTSSYVWDCSSCLCKSFEMFPFSLINGDAEFICVQVSTRRIYTQSVTHAQARAQTGREPDRQKTDTCNRMRGGLT